MNQISREFQFERYGETYTGRLVSSKYASNDNTAVLLEVMSEYGGWGLFTKVSINTELALPPGMFVAKHYSENEGILEMLVMEGLISVTDKSVSTGYTSCVVATLVEVDMHGPECPCNECLEMVECGDFDMGGEG